MEINPLDYDIYHVGVSGGKDSTAVLLWLVYESGWPLDRVRVTFCDTGNEDALTYAYLEMLSSRIHPITTIHPERDFWELAAHEKRFPSRKARFCTQFLKVTPSRTHVLNLAAQGARVLLLNGVRAGEAHSGNHRGTALPFEFDDGWGCDVYRPVLDWQMPDIWDIARRHIDLEDVLSMLDRDPHLAQDHKDNLIAKILSNGIPRNPLYDMGASRVGCFPCINSRKRELRALAKYRPERIEFLSQMENKVGRHSNVGYSSFFARKTVPLAHRSKLITTTKGEQMRVATIHDVVRWSQTAMYRPNQFNFDPDIMENTAASACDIGGLCE